MTPLALVGGTIYANPADDPIRDGVVLIEDETIVAAGRRCTRRRDHTIAQRHRDPSEG